MCVSWIRSDSIRPRRDNLFLTLGIGAAGDQDQSMDRKRIAARDRRNAAVHEAGHIVVARWARAGVASAWIIQNDGLAADEKAWAGRVQIISVSDVNPHRRRMIGVAGAVAEHLWCDGWIEDFWPDGMSDSDWRLAGCGPDEYDDALWHAIHSVGRMFRADGPVWPAVLREARRLIVNSR
jgi:hypothetical protein